VGYIHDGGYTPLSCRNPTSSLELVLVLVLLPVLLAFPVLEQPFPEQAQEEVLAWLPLLPQAEALTDRNQPTQSLQKT
jgi:hypothetical protein